MKAREIMTAQPACCTPNARLSEVAQMMIDNDCGEIPVLDDDASRRLLGVITDRDIAVRAVARGMDVNTTKAGDIMSAPVITVHRESSLDECRQKMEQHQVRRIPVVDDAGGVCGIVAQADIARLGVMQETAKLVRDVLRPAQ